MTETVAATACYVYAIVGPVDARVRVALPEGLELVGGDELAAVVARVPLDEFGEDVLAERLNDRVWLEEKARAHEEVVQRLLPATAVVPLRFGSIHRDEAAVDAFVAGRRDELADALARVRGCVEVGVKVWRRRPPPAPAPSAATGREYLERRRHARDRAEGAATELAGRLAHAHERLLAAAEAGVLNRPQPRELTQRDDEMLMNAAYLVHAGDERLGAEVDKLQHEDDELTYELTGPWAPYNFVALEER